MAKVTNTFTLSCLLILLCNSLIKPSDAQTVDNIQQTQNSPLRIPPPQDVQPPSPRQPPPSPPRILPPPSELLKPSQPITPSDEQPALRGLIFRVEQFQITGNTVFSDEKLTELLKEFTQEPINFEKLLEARSKINQLYLDEGYITSGAFIPEQTLDDGVVEIQIVEGKLEDIKITGLRKLKPNYIRSRIGLGASTPLNREDLLGALQVLQINPLIQNLEAKLSPGSRLGNSLLSIEVTEADSFNTQITLDNARSPSVGSFRRQVQVREGNLLGLGDSISAAYSNTEDRKSVV